MGTFPFDLTLEELTRRRSAKWTIPPRAGVPMWVAEMDVRLAPPVAQALHRAIDESDTGYAGDAGGYVDAFAQFARRRWGWTPPTGDARVFSDLAAAGRYLLDTVADGAGVVITPPVYNSFPTWLDAARVTRVDVPLLAPETGGRLDLRRIRDALAAGARAVLISTRTPDRRAAPDAGPGRPRRPGRRAPRRRRRRRDPRAAGASGP